MSRRRRFPLSSAERSVRGVKLANPAHADFYTARDCSALQVVLPALANRLRSAKWPGGELTFSEKLEAIEESPPAVALLNTEKSSILSNDPTIKLHEGKNGVIGPSELIEDAWAEFTAWVRARANTENIDTEHSLGLPYMIGRLMVNHTSAEADQMVKLYQEVADLRQDVMYAPWKVTVDDAGRFGRLLRLIRARLEM